MTAALPSLLASATHLPPDRCEKPSGPRGARGIDGIRRLARSLLSLAGTLAICASSGTAADWVRAGLNTNQPVWGLRGGLLFAIHPGGFSGRDGGPRGLIRVGYPTLTNGGYDLINFIAVEPVVRGIKGFSELEHSALDQQKGKRFWVEARSGKLASTNGVEELDVLLLVERFDNGAHVRVRLTQRSDAPDELRLVIEPEPDSAPLDSCILTATMGNKARARHLWLADGPVSSLELYPDYTGPDFAPDRVFPLERLPRTAGGDVLVALTTNEEDPAAVATLGRPSFWDYRGRKVTQYWRKPAATTRADLHCAVNGRFTYWQSNRPIPGGIAFENFELRQKFRAGDDFIFGVTFRPPAELVATGKPSRAAEPAPPVGGGVSR